MKKFLSLLVAFLMAAGCLGAAGADAFTPGTYEATEQGFGGAVTVSVTVDGNAVTAVEITGENETPGLGLAAIDVYKESLVGLTSAEEMDLTVDVATSASVTTGAIQRALQKALALASGEAAVNDAPISFVPGTYTAQAEGYNGPVTVEATFSDTAVTDIQVTQSGETAHVGDVAYAPMIADMLACNGSGVDAVSGATFSSRALRNAVNDAAAQAQCANLDAFKANTVVHEAGAAEEYETDVVIVGAGGAGIAAAAQATQNGSSVILIEKNAEMGGNTLVSGGQYQSVATYLVWDPADPDAETGVGYDGQTYTKVKSVQGCIAELKTILNWNEEEFDADWYKDNEFVAGDTAELSKHGVHADYLPTLKALKAEIQAYLDWAQPQLDAGVPEGQLTLFSTLNLHIFQTYYGGLRPSADGSEWCYGDIDLVSQFIAGGQDLKPWLESQGATLRRDTQPTLIGALWYRENEFIGAEIDTDGDGQTESYGGRWGTYFMAPYTTFASNENNKLLLRTTAESLICDDTGRVVGVNAVRYDGTPVTVKASKGVILATGGYAANIGMVVSENVYWSSEFVDEGIETTNRSSLQGDGIVMAEAVGAATTGLGFTQMMPISWVDNGDLAFGGGNYAIYINPTTGHRFVDEGSERDVLSLGEFRNGVEVNGTKGVFLEIYNSSEPIPGPIQLAAEGDYEGRYYRRTIDQLDELFDSLGFACSADTVIETIRAYDMAVMGQGEFPDVGKAIASRTIGNVEKNEDGSYNVDSYDLENTLLTVRLMAPSTHHTMGGLVVDVDRHVLTADGTVIPGLYAAGEVTGGIHGGNRLGGNAIVEIFVSGRTAADTVETDNP